MKEGKWDSGFTLIELLVVVAIIGILAAIAIPQFAVYRQKGFDARGESDLRNAASAEEAYFATNSVYVTCTDTTCGDGTTLPGFQKSDGVTIAMTGATATFSGTATHTGGTGKTWTYLSGSGGIQ
jgi:prepilin-type N-terminal cleavage/methylation domain-containing protein